MILLSALDLARQFDVDPVFQGVTFDVSSGEKIGLVGPNGAGKTTLFRVLTGQDEPDVGRIERPSSVTLAMLEQEAKFAPERTLIEEARTGLDHLYALQRESEDLAHRMAATGDPSESERLHRRFDFLQQELHRLDAYAIDHRVDEVLTGLGFSKDEYDRPLATFSGGQQNRAILARLLLRAPDLMLLDEPTNHLDIAATEWLEGYLARSDQAVLLISHDRWFLDRVTNRIFELHRGRLTDYKGNFSAYWEQRADRNKVLERTYEKQQEFIAKTEDFIRRNKYGQKHAQAADREKKLARVESVDRPQEITSLPMRFGQTTRTGDWVIDAVDVAKGFPGPDGEVVPLFHDFTLRIHRGDRVAILGPNGSGKTTLLRTLLGEYAADAGKIRLGTGVKIGYYDQQLASVDPSLDAVEAIRPANDPTMMAPKLRDILARFGIRGDRAFQRLDSMSGGEKSKVALARLAALDINVLVLDEPTNHLDLWARDSLEQALAGFDGTLIFVSHDRYFVDRVARSVIVLEPDRWRFHEGNYSAYVDFREGREPVLAPPPTVAPPSSTPTDSSEANETEPPKRKRQFPYRKTHEIEADIDADEELVQRLEVEMANPDNHRDPERIKTIVADYDAAKARLVQLYEHWDEALELN